MQTRLTLLLRAAALLLAVQLTACGGAPAAATPAPAGVAPAQQVPAQPSLATAAPTPLPTSTLAPGAPTPTPIEVLASPAWLATAVTYRDEVAGIQLQVPAEWTVLDVAPEIKAESTGYAVTFMSWSSQAPGSGGIPEGGSKFDLLITRSDVPDAQTAANLRRQELREGLPEATVSEAISQTLADGTVAMRWDVESPMATVYELFTATGEHVIILSGLGDRARFDEIAATLTLLD